MNIILIGYKCCGKSSVALSLEKNYHIPAIDTDTLILRQQKTFKTLTHLTQALGIEQLRKLEHRIISTIKCVNNTVIATGGGTVLSPQCVKQLKMLGKTLYLKTEKKILYQRLKNLTPSPSFIDKDNFHESLFQYIHSRDTLYEQVADIILDISSMHIDEVAHYIHDHFFKKQ